MKKSKKFFALVLSAVMALSALSLPAFAAGTGLGGAKYPTVFVHGLLGWGSYDEVNDLVPYFGMTTGDLTAYLQAFYALGVDAVFSDFPGRAVAAR